MASFGSALAQFLPDAPVGLVWGSSASEIQAEGVEFKELAGTEFGKSFIASKMEKALAAPERSTAVIRLQR